MIEVQWVKIVIEWGRCIGFLYQSRESLAAVSDCLTVNVRAAALSCFVLHYMGKSSCIPVYYWLLYCYLHLMPRFYVSGRD